MVFGALAMACKEREHSGGLEGDFLAWCLYSGRASCNSQG